MNCDRCPYEDTNECRNCKNIKENDSSRKIICGVTIDETELHKEIKHWVRMYERQCEENIKLVKELYDLKKKLKMKSDFI